MGHLLPYLDLSIFGSMQAYVLRQGETPSHLEALEDVHTCTLPHLIHARPELPYLDLNALNGQRVISNLIGLILETLYPYKRL